MLISPAAEREGRAEIWRHRRNSWRVIAAVGIFSIVVNMLMLTAPIFMLQVYDRVLSSRSVETLTALFLIVAFLFLMMGLLDIVRNRIMQREAIRFQLQIQDRIYRAALDDAALSPAGGPPQAGLRDLEAITRFLASPVLLALFDLPLAPFFLGAVYIFHPLLGVVATAGGAVLITCALLNQYFGHHPLREARIEAMKAERLADQYRDEGEAIGSMGMRGASFERWRITRQRAAMQQLRAGDRVSGFTTFSRIFRHFLQSAMLATGAWLVLQNALSPGAMIASSVMMGRALAPIDQIVSGWPLVNAAQDGTRRLAILLGRRPPQPARTPLPRPAARIKVQGLMLAPPGGRQPTLRGISFELDPGQALGVIGPSGAGKTTLARALIGAWGLAAGSIRIDGATLQQYEPDALGQLIGYVPQQVTLFDGTIAENIARLSATRDTAKVIAAARGAAAHEMILRLPSGYDTVISQTGGQLSGGQIQRIGLARALYTDPVLLVLDEPNSNLDNVGSVALNDAIKSLKLRGGAAIVMAHRPAAITECDLLLMLEEGYQRTVGPRDEVLRSNVTNARHLRAVGQAGIV